MFEIFQYSFFQKALLGGILIALLSSVLGVFIVMRKESNIAHSIANFIFLGIAFSFLLNGNYYFYGFLFAIFGAFFIHYIERTDFITKESNKEIIAQAGMAGGIFVISLLGNIQFDIYNFLFGNILLTNFIDILIISLLGVLGFILFFIFGHNFLAINISEDISKTKGIHSNIYHLIFTLFLAVTIGASIKIFGILLIGAFLVIPANIGKILGNSIQQVFYYAMGISSTSVIIGLFGAHLFESSSGSTIVSLLVCIFLSVLIYKERKK